MTNVGGVKRLVKQLKSKGKSVAFILVEAKKISEHVVESQIREIYDSTD